MALTHSTPVTTAATDQHPTHRMGYLAAGLLATVAAAVAVTVVAVVARAAGVDFELPDGKETIPTGGFPQMTVIVCLLGLAIAAALNRWAARPASTFARTAWTLTALSLVPPFLVQANAATVVTLLALHLVAAAVVIPVVSRRLPAARSRR